jgi:curved DNA-binding protein
MEYKDYYKILGVERGTTEAEIKKAYRRLARKYHPDVSKEADAEKKFKEVGEAYEVLKDPQKRQAYDQLGANWKAGQNFNPPTGWEEIFSNAGFSGRASAGQGFSSAEFSGSGFSDFFETLFGGGFSSDQFSQAGRGFGQSGFQSKGADQHANISISLEDSFTGVKKSIRLRSGRNLDVKIPKGITTGKRIRLAGQGGPGAGGDPNGDLYLEVTISPHRLFKVEGKNVLLDLPITPWEAALGARVQVPTLGGRVATNIPAGSQSGKKLRLKNRGLSGQPAGDQIVTLQIVVPEITKDEDKLFYEEMQKRYEFNPRKNV